MVSTALGSITVRAAPTARRAQNPFGEMRPGRSQADTEVAPPTMRSVVLFRYERRKASGDRTIRRSERSGSTRIMANDPMRDIPNAILRTNEEVINAGATVYFEFSRGTPEVPLDRSQRGIEPLVVTSPLN
jgi:hypothetical protein